MRKTDFFSAVAICLLFSSSVILAGSKSSTGTGNWNTPGTWTPSGVPGSTDNVTILNGHTVTVDVTADILSLTINSGGTLTSGNYTLKIENGGNFTNNGIFNAGIGEVWLYGSNTMSGTIAFNTVRLMGNLVNFGPSSTINSDFWIYPTGFVAGVSSNTDGPSYGPSSRLLYNIGGAYQVGNEWYGGVTSGVGVPQKVEIGNNTVLTLLSNSNLNVIGDVVIDVGSTFVFSNSSNGGIQLGGNWTNNGTFTSNGNLVGFNGSSGQQSIGGSSSTTFGRLQVNNAAGLSLSTPATVSTRLDLTSGTIVSTTTNLLTLASTVSTINQSLASSFVAGPMAQTWTTSTASLTFPIGKGSTYRPLVISLTSPSSPVIRAEVFNSPCGGSPGSLNAISSVRYYQTALLSGTATGGGNVQITYGTDDVVTDNTTLAVAQCATVNGTYASLGRSASTTSTVTSDGSGSPYNPASGSYLVLATTGSNPLPVQMMSFTAAASQHGARISWQTASETDCFGFEIERMFVGTDARTVSQWISVGFLKGSGTSSTPRAYSYTDTPANAGRYAYRIKQIDANGKSNYSSTVEIELGNTPKEFWLGQNYPNPFNPTTDIEFSVPVDGKVQLKVYNTLGEEVATLLDQIMTAGEYHRVSFDATHLGSGVYFARLQFDGQQLVKKMLVMK